MRAARASCATTMPWRAAAVLSDGDLCRRERAGAGNDEGNEQRTQHLVFP